MRCTFVRFHTIPYHTNLMGSSTYLRQDCIFVMDRAATRCAAGALGTLRRVRAELHAARRRDAGRLASPPPVPAEVVAIAERAKCRVEKDALALCFAAGATSPATTIFLHHQRQELCHRLQLNSPSGVLT